jgi:hypothetical protein
METLEKKPFENFRDAILSMYDIGDTMNVFGYAHKLCISLRLETITPDQYNGLCSELMAYCYREKIETTNEVVSLF